MTMGSRITNVTMYGKPAQQIWIVLMEDLVALFKAAPLEAIGVAICAGIGYLWKNRQERGAEAESRSVDRREIERLNRVIDIVTEERDEERERADIAFAKQLELTERFSEMRAQNAQVLQRMEQLSEQMRIVLDENAQLRGQVSKLTDEMKTLRVSLQPGTPT